MSGARGGVGTGSALPLALSIDLPRDKSTVIFIATGLGAALLPWVTGVLSTAFGSLRAGLLAPYATVAIPLWAAIFMRQKFLEQS